MLLGPELACPRPTRPVPCVAAQVLRTRFVADVSGSQAGPQQIVLPADAVSLEEGAAETNGAPLLRRAADGSFELAEHSSLSAEWRAFTTASFDLFSGSLVRMKVRIQKRTKTTGKTLEFQSDCEPPSACVSDRPRADVEHTFPSRPQSLWLQVWRVAPREHVLLVVQHHSITDGTSLGILSRDLAAAYNAALQRTQPQWQSLSIAYVDYAAWQRQQLAGAALEAELEWWKHTLAGAPALLELPADRLRPEAMSFAGAELSFSMPASVQRGVQALAAAQQTTTFVVLLTALQVQSRLTWTNQQRTLRKNGQGCADRAGADS